MLSTWFLLLFQTEEREQYKIKCKKLQLISLDSIIEILSCKSCIDWTNNYHVNAIVGK